jgi:hypothetical protein
MASAADKNRAGCEPDEREMAELSALADGRVGFVRRRRLEARIAKSPALRACYEEQLRAVEMLRVTRHVRAPPALRARIDGHGAVARRISLRPAYALTLAGAVAIVVLALGLVLPRGTPNAPSLSQAAALASRGSPRSAPPPDPSDPSIELGRRVGKIYFPNWSTRFGWRAVGQRVDHLDGRLTVTVYYAWHGRRIAYTIVAAPALAQPRAAVRPLEGTELRTLTINGRLVVTWRRAGHTCVLSGKHVADAQLQQLAAWMAPDPDRAPNGLLARARLIWSPQAQATAQPVDAPRAARS